jgi:transcriptional regulator with XRE-family HTH domain
MERSPSRIVAIEQSTTDITVATLARLAHALGYRAEIVLESLDGQGQRLSAQIDFHEGTESTKPTAPLLQGTVRLPTRKLHVNR